MEAKPTYAELEQQVKTLLQEVGEHKRAAEQLKVAEQQFRAIISNLPGAVYRSYPYDDWTATLYLNDAMEDLCGYPASDFVSNRIRSYWSIIHPDDRKMVEKVVNLGIADKRPFSIEYRILHADGGARWVHEHGRGVYGQSGSVLWLDGAIFDIDDKKQAEKALRENRRRYRDLVETIKDWIWEIDARGVFGYVSPKVVDLLGYEPVEVVGKKLSDLIAPAEPDSMVGLFKQGRGLREPFTAWECRFCHRDGHLVHTETSGVPIFDAQGVYLGTRGVTRDINNRKLMEEERIKREKLQGVLEMAGAVSHELNQPMTAIVLISRLLLEDLDEDNPLYADLSKIKEQILRMGKITAELMHIATYQTLEYVDGQKIIDIHRAAAT
jgi:PAS domain S-box-containing protein